LCGERNFVDETETPMLKIMILLKGEMNLWIKKYTINWSETGYQK